MPHFSRMLDVSSFSLKGIRISTPIPEFVTLATVPVAFTRWPESGKVKETAISSPICSSCWVKIKTPEELTFRIRPLKWQEFVKHLTATFWFSRKTNLASFLDFRCTNRSTNLSVLGNGAGAGFEPVYDLFRPRSLLSPRSRIVRGEGGWGSQRRTNFYGKKG